MSESQKSAESKMNILSRNITLLEGKRNAYFGRIQTLYDTIPRSVDDHYFKQFMSNASKMDVLRNEFTAVVEELNRLCLQESATFVPNYEALWSFDDLFNNIASAYNEFKHKNNSSAPASHEKGFNSHIKLEKLSIPEFYGEYEKFPMFIESFNTMVHYNTSLDDTLRVRYLVSKLKGKAESIWLGINPTAENYKLIYHTLCQKYQDVRAVAVTYLERLLNSNKLMNPTPAQFEDFVDQFSTSVAALKQIKLDDLLDFIFVHLGIRRLDSETAKLFEMSIRKQDIPKYAEFLEFLQEQSKIINRTNEKFDRRSTRRTDTQFNKQPRAFVVNSKIDNQSCLLCRNTDHQHFYGCPIFNNLTPHERFDLVKKNHCCINCLSFRHIVSSCKSTVLCKHCNKPHHTLLHFSDSGTYPQNNLTALRSNQHMNADTWPQPTTSSPPQQEQHTVSLCSAVSYSEPRRTVLLGTAVVEGLTKNGSAQNIRILVDMGSQNHFISKYCCKRLKLDILNDSLNTLVKGIGNNSQSVLGFTNITLRSRYEPTFNLQLQPLILNKISSEIPESRVEVESLNYLKGLPLADENYYMPGNIDLLLGSEVFMEILRSGKIMGPPGKPDALETAFGYLILGSANFADFSPPHHTQSFLSTRDQPLNHLLTKFWTIEEPPVKKYFSPADEECERIYLANILRDENGRFITALPFKQTPASLGDSYSQALRRFNTLERKFNLNHNFREKYDSVINDYIKNDYIRVIPPSSFLADNRLTYFIPHHGVCRDDKITTKLRIVMDASAATSTGVSLNDCLYSGPNLQRELTEIILSFRLFPIAITSDVKQMFLQILIRPEDRKYLRLLYRFKNENVIKMYEFNRLCFGLTCSPYLAMRTIRELATREQILYPRAAQVVMRDIYMDDLGTSVMSVGEAKNLSQELIQLFKCGGFDLVKFISNSSELLSTIPDSNLLTQNFEFGEGGNFKLLGLNWDPLEDHFFLSINPTPKECTKRTMLSVIARLWDINGYCAPVILYAKNLIKRLWIEKVDWDSRPSEVICNAWEKFIGEFHLLSKFRIPRFLGISSPDSKVVLLGFSDASELAYGAAVYLCVLRPDSSNIVNLLYAKSKVAPLKVITLARLELCGVLLMSKLLKFVKDNISQRHPIHDIYAFTDSTIALHWTQSSPHRFSTFVAHRITEIQENLPAAHFYHIDGKENPADCLSRGITPAQLIKHPLWMHGPEWARKDPVHWPLLRFQVDENYIGNETKFEYKNTVNNFVVVTNNAPFFCTLASRFSTWDKLLRTTVYILRFVKKLPRLDHIDNHQLKFATDCIIRDIQKLHFSNEIKLLSQNKDCKLFRHLTPFMHEGLLRVGGRLECSKLPFDAKHPVLLPKRDHIVDMLVCYFHRKYLHAGPELLLSLIRREYWIISGRFVVRKIFRLCNICFKAAPRSVTPLMGNLPSCRVNEVKPFLRTGVDFAGPIAIINSRFRGVRQEKAYICLFTCLVTRAVHLELARDLSTDAFIRAFRRFISRRGNCDSLYSDNGTNFIGTKSYFNDLHQLLSSKTYIRQFLEETNSHGITWHLNPPSAPHFGGAWESNIKSVKTHLRRTIGNVLLTYEELYTILTQIECILNSRPLTALSSSPTDPEALTPAHFLTYGPLNEANSIVFNSTDSVQPRCLIHRKRLLDHVVATYWTRWRQEYITSLQNRQKWNKHSNPISKGQLVILKNENTPCLQWPLGIIEDTHTGPDGVTRVVNVRTRHGTYLRPVVKVCPLPSQ